MSKRIKDIIKNLFLSFLSYALPTAVLQFVIQPLIADKLGAELNGQYLTLMSLNYFVVGITGGVLCTVRMLKNNEYEEEGVKGDFNVFMLFYSALLVVVLTAGHIFYLRNINLVDIALYILIGILYLYHNYIFCQYRLKFQFNKILINNIVQVVGYFVGYALFCFVGKWQFVIIGAYLLGGIYDYLNTDFIKEPLVITPLFKKTRSSVAVLTVSTALGSVITYCDKLLLYPMLGGTLVSIYSAASLVGKMLILLSSPINSVLLSYLVEDNRIKFKIRFKHILIGVIGATVAYVACVVVGYPLVDLLYPSWSAEAHRYIPLTVFASLLTFFAGLLNTVVIRFCKTYYQVVVQGTEIVIYLVLSLLLLSKYSMIGYCYGVVASALIKMIMLIIILYKHIKTEENKS